MRSHAKPVILCIDDEKLDLDLQQSAFEEYGFAVHRALNWEAAREVLLHSRIDIVVLDYRLVHAHAVEVAVEIRKLSPRMPIVLLSGYLHDVPEYFKHAVDGCLSKNEVPEAWIVELLRHFEPGMSVSA